LLGSAGGLSHHPGSGKTAVTCFLPTYNFEFWLALQRDDPVRYKAEKQRIANAVIAIFEQRVAGVRQAIEVVDVSTPATVIRYTGNWKGSMEGWLLTPRTGLRPLPNCLPGLRRFRMVGQRVTARRRAAVGSDDGKGGPAGGMRTRSGTVYGLTDA
jgi:phytoene dehydrogenase-like protein